MKSPALGTRVARSRHVPVRPRALQVTHRRRRCVRRRPQPLDGLSPASTRARDAVQGRAVLSRRHGMGAGHEPRLLHREELGQGPSDGGATVAEALVRQPRRRVVLRARRARHRAASSFRAQSQALRVLHERLSAGEQGDEVHRAPQPLHSAQEHREGHPRPGRLPQRRPARARGWAPLRVDRGSTRPEPRAVALHEAGQDPETRPRRLRPARQPFHALGAAQPRMELRSSQPVRTHPRTGNASDLRNRERAGMRRRAQPRKEETQLRMGTGLLVRDGGHRKTPAPAVVPVEPGRSTHRPVVVPGPDESSVGRPLRRRLPHGPAASLHVERRRHARSQTTPDLRCAGADPRRLQGPRRVAVFRDTRRHLPHRSGGTSRRSDTHGWSPA
jgi:hypothetical protein